MTEKYEKRTFRTTRDIVIPAGTILIPPPQSSSRFGKDWEAVVGVDNDHVGYFSMDLEEAKDAGLVERV